MVGELDRALELLVGLLANATFDMKAWVLNDSDFVPLHKLPGWQKVLALTK